MLLHRIRIIAGSAISPISHEGHLINEEQAALIQQDFIGRMLSSEEARRVRNIVGRRAGDRETGSRR